MKIKVHHDRCQGHAMCVMKAPDVYELDEDGYNKMPVFVVKPGMEEQATSGEWACPERAIEILEE